MSNNARKSLLDLIRLNIAQHGHHVYLISGESLPRYAYTIGVSQLLGVELILAGTSFYSADEVGRIVNTIAADLRRHGAWHDSSIVVDSMGTFSLRKADESWVTPLMLGALDYYGEKVISALQIVPDQAHWTIDIPDITRPWNAATEPIWQWLHEPWGYLIPSKAVAITNLGALRGEQITEAVRWEEDQWEVFAGSGTDVTKADMRVVPLATLLAVDESPDAIAGLQIGCGVWRDVGKSEWHSWV